MPQGILLEFDFFKNMFDMENVLVQIKQLVLNLKSVCGGGGRKKRLLCGIGMNNS